MIWMDRTRSKILYL